MISKVKQNSNTYLGAIRPRFTYKDAHQSTALADFIHALLERIQELDTRRLKMEQESWEVEDLWEITRLLETDIAVTVRGKPHTASLKEQTKLQSIIALCPGYHLDIRRGENGLPLYLLCRTGWDHWSGYGLIVETLYQSPGYRLFDPRFLRLIINNREVNVLNLAPLRHNVAQIFTHHHLPESYAVDETLLSLARLVFHAAWHEDQSLGIAAAECFGLEYFKETIELLYLCLSGDLCHLRNHPQDTALQYLRDKHDNPYLYQFIERLSSLSGPSLGYLPQKAMKLFSALSSSFHTFINVPIPWGVNTGEVPLCKVLFANYTRLRQIAGLIPISDSLKAQKELLEQESLATINSLLNV